MKNNIIRIGKYVITFIALLIIFNLLLAISCIIPKEFLKEHIFETRDILIEEGSKHYISQTFNVRIDTDTDSVIANEAYSIDTKHPFQSYMTMKKNYDPVLTKRVLQKNVGDPYTVNYNKKVDKEYVTGRALKYITEFSNFIDGKIRTAISYERYWHGYMSLYRPLFVIFNINGIRVFQLVVFLLLLIAVCYMVYKKYGTQISIITAFSIVLNGYFSAACSLECAPIFFVLMIGLIVFLQIKNLDKYIYYYLFIMACVTNYFDFLTIPLVTLCIPLFLYLIDKTEELSFKDVFVIIIKACLIWGIGYAVTWASKFVLYDLIFNPQEGVLINAFNQVLHRTVNVGAFDLGSVFALVMVYVFITSFYGMIYILIINFVNLIRKQKMQLSFKGSYMNFLIISVFPIVWYIGLLNHTAEHFYFTYRMLSIFLMGMLLFAYKLRKKES